MNAGARRGALGLGPPFGAERFAVGAATLGVLSLAAEAAPVVILVDDLHWPEAGSRDAILFAARRLGPYGVAIVTSIRDPEGRAINTPAFVPLPIQTMAAPRRPMQ